MLRAYLEKIARDAIQRALHVDAPAIVRTTQDREHGDYQINGILPLGKKLGQPPRQLATLVADAIRDHEVIASAEVAGPGFVNLRLKDSWVALALVRAIQDKERDGVARTEQPQKIVVDFSSPNVAKQMHVGHLRPTVIGDAVQRLLRFAGHDVIADNHVGDWGTQFGLIIAGVKLWGTTENHAEPISALEQTYVLASAKAKEDTAFAEQARIELALLQKGDAENVALWQKFVAISRAVFDRIYERLDIRFDEWLGESEYNAMLPSVVKKLVDLGLAREDQGAICVFFNEHENAPAELKSLKTPYIVQKKDGAYLYSTTDIATILSRRERHAPSRIIYVVDARQSLHFKQLFAVAHMLGERVTLEHVGFGTILGKDSRPLRTRDGGNVLLESFLNEAEERAAARIREAKLEVSEDRIAEVSRVVGLGAVKYADLRQNRLSDYQFDWDKLISFQGNAGPYLQYAYARIQSIFRKGAVSPDELNGEPKLTEAAEAYLARRLLEFSDVVHEAAETYQPHLLCEHLYELAKAFSSFYESCPILKSEEETRRSRLMLAALTARQLRRGLSLLGIATVDSM